MDDDLRVQAKALGDPTRYAMFAHVRGAPGPVGVAELTDLLGLNHNAVRVHLSKLVDAGLFTESRARPQGPGRPRLQYAVHPSAESRWGAVGPYERLSQLLTEVVRTGESVEEVGRRAGASLVPGGRRADDPTGAFVDEMARHGFDPELHTSGDEVEVTLRACPFTSAALTDPSTICGLHLGLALGVADAVGGLEVEELVPRDPRRANCRLRCRLVPEG